MGAPSMSHTTAGVLSGMTVGAVVYMIIAIIAS